MTPLAPARARDVAFIRTERLPAPMPAGYPRLAPDFVAEVRSPNDSETEIQEKVSDWLAAGTRLVWVIDPRARSARVHRADGSATAIVIDGLLGGEDVLPGFTLELSAILR